MKFILLLLAFLATANTIAIAQWSGDARTPMLVSESNDASRITYEDGKGGVTLLFTRMEDGRFYSRNFDRKGIAFSEPQLVDDIGGRRSNAKGFNSTRWIASTGDPAIAKHLDAQGLIIGPNLIELSNIVSSDIAIAEDGEGGAIVFTTEAGTTKIWAERVSSKHDLAWDSPILVEDGLRPQAQVISSLSNGAGAAILSYRVEPQLLKLQCVSNNASISWSRELRTKLEELREFSVNADSNGGVFVTWLEFIEGKGYRFRITHIDKFGEVTMPDSSITYPTSPIFLSGRWHANTAPSGHLQLLYGKSIYPDDTVYAQRFNGNGLTQWSSPRPLYSLPGIANGIDNDLTFTSKGFCILRTDDDPEPPYGGRVLINSYDDDGKPLDGGEPTVVGYLGIPDVSNSPRLTSTKDQTFVDWVEVLLGKLWLQALDGNGALVATSSVTEHDVFDQNAMEFDGTSEIRIYDLLGRLIGVLACDQHTLHKKLADLRRGAYMIRIGARSVPFAKR